MGRYQSGQMGLTVNQVAMPSGVRIPLFPQKIKKNDKTNQKTIKNFANSCR